MLPKHHPFAVYPTVAEAHREIEVVIAPTERAFLFFEGEEYTLTLIPIFEDENYYVPHNQLVLKPIAHDGVLRFSYDFPGEGEYLLLLSREEKAIAELSVYAVCEDLYALTPLKGDLHGHSYRSDGKTDPAALAGHYREQGYDFFALTDHNRFYPGDEIDEVYGGINTDLVRIRGEEVHCPDSVLHVVHVGGKSSVTECYFHHREEYVQELAACRTHVPEFVPEIYRERYAAALWATDRIHRAGGLAIFAHPYWRPGKSMSFNVDDTFTAILLNSGMFDAFELVGGMKQDGINRAVAHWSELRARGLRIPVVGSSDVHNVEKCSTFTNLFTICFAKEKTHDAIIDSVRTGHCVAVEATGVEQTREYRVHGDLRLVAYAQFLLRHYFPKYQRVAQGIGVAMRAFSMGEVSREVVELQAEMSENYRARFFGRRAPVLPSPALLEFEDRHRARHLQGPQTKGSSVSAPPVTIQI